MKIWWQQLKISEQRLVAVMGVVVICILFFSLIWQPLVEDINKTQNKIARQQLLLTVVQDGTQRYQQAKRNGTSSQSKGSLSSIVNQSAGRNNITIARLLPQEDDLQVWIDEVPFSQLLGWLEYLANKEGLLVKSIDLSKADVKGVVKVRRLQLGKS
jgi:general secretion pathway protein M